MPFWEKSKFYDYAWTGLYIKYRDIWIIQYVLSFSDTSEMRSSKHAFTPQLRQLCVLLAWNTSSSKLKTILTISNRSPC